MKLRHLIVLPALALVSTGCETAANLVMEPAVTDPLDGYHGYAEAGVNTDLDWGPGQEHLLTKYQELLKERAALVKDKEDLIAQNQNLQSQLTDAKGSLETERGERSQAEAETELLRGKVRERDAKILALSIEKARLEQERLASQIAALTQSLDAMQVTPTEAAATPGRRP